MVKKLIILILTFNILISCQDIETGKSLNKKTIMLIKDMGLLDNDEKIAKYYSNYSEDKAGNFFTDKRIAHYWLDENDNSKTDVSFAYYEDIIAIDTNFIVYDFDIPYMTIWKKDSTNFRVFIDGTEKQKRDFFNEAIDIWKRNR